MGRTVQLTIFDELRRQGDVGRQRPKVDSRQCRHFEAVGTTSYRCRVGEFGCLCSATATYGEYMGCRQFVAKE